MESGNIMTNANVTAVVVGKSGRTVTMQYDRSSAVIVIPRDVPIYRIALGKPSDLRAGQHVTVRGEASGGAITAASITIE
jgi:hypothetical protein